MAAVATLAFAATAVLVPGTANAATYDGQDPIASGCASSVITARLANIRGYDGITIVGQIQLRYSTACRTVWGRIVAYYNDYNAHAYVNRNSDGAWYNCVNPTWSNNLAAYSCYTPMLNDANVTSYADGYAATTDYVISYGRTTSY
ncbi:hypothetical protein Rhe02_59000 [Rhizocola hellebori]|uniref:DUF2690 domain-containing protein n=1 Tax=Rhizocola hellebori TaxID=1392758 RepID=A0A8J3QBJ3_9ACTN|nr:DUF2690 domain-containing protein [Rhizocola hellebori]GIH07833.1 hypothetical protein Rhe02_59000 [Rhizocola hellebori]